MLFDTHAHLDDRRFDLDREELLSRLPEQGIGLLMNPGCDLPCPQPKTGQVETTVCKCGE